MQIKDVMQGHPESVTPATLLAEAAQHMNALGVPMLPVCENGKLVGVLAARDLTVRATAEGLNPRISTVREVMTRAVIFAAEDHAVDETAALMRRYRLSQLPVLDRQHRLVGVISLSDLHESRRGSSIERSRR